MPSILTRRRVLVSTGSAVALTGCLGRSDTEADLTGATQTSGQTSDVPASSSSPSPPCTVEADRPASEFGPPYPPLSSVDSPALAMDFAFAFEEALQRNRVQILEPQASYVRLESKDATEPESVDRGFLVGVRVELAYGREVHTSRDPDVERFHDTRSVAAGYFVGDRAVRVRTETLTVVDPRQSPDGEVVACEE